MSTLVTRNGVMSQLNLDSSIDKLLPSNYQELCKLLNIHDIWKDLACVVQNRNKTAPRFTHDDILTFERYMDPAYQLLNTWKTDYVTLRQLADCLQSAGLLREATYIRGLVQPPALPSSPAERQDDVQIKYTELCKWTSNFNDVPVHRGGNLLGHGGYAEVFKGYDDKLQRLVAVKRLKTEALSAGSHSAQQQFHNEINILSSCEHGNVVKLFGYSTDGPCRCIIYELMSNGSLEDRLSSSRLSVAQRLLIAADATCGLAYLHSEQCLIHMDVKSANILLDDRMTAKVSDYGITRSSPSNEGHTSDNTNVIIGTTVYMAPEYLVGGRVSDKIDAYSFGVVLLELLTGLPAFDQHREDASLVVHVRENSDENSIAILDEKAGDWTITNVQRIYQTAVQLLSEYKTRPRIVEIIKEVESWHSTAT